MLDALDAVQVLRSLRPKTAVATPYGHGVVWCQLRDKVLVLVEGRLLVELYRWECGEVGQ